MAKTKKNIDAFSEALLSNTRVIGGNSKTRSQSGKSDSSEKKSGTAVTISQKQMAALESLSKKYDIKIEVLVSVAIDFIINGEEQLFS